MIISDEMLYAQAGNARDMWISTLLQTRTPDESEAEQYLDSEGTLHPQLVLVSYNKAYSPIVVPPEASFQIVGRVL